MRIDPAICPRPEGPSCGAPPCGGADRWWGDPFELGLWLLILGIPCSRALIEIGATVLIAAGLWRKWQARDLALRRSPLAVPIASFTLWAALSLCWTQHTFLTLKAIIGQTLEYTAIYLAISDGLRDGQRGRRLIWGWLWWSVAMAADGAIQLLRGHDLAGYAPGLLAGGARVTAAMVYPNDYGAYTALSAILAIGVAVGERFERRQRLGWVAGGIAAINLAGLVLTYSRGAWLGFALAGIVAVLLYRTRYVIPLIVATAVVLTLLPPLSLDRLASIFDLHAGSSAQERLLIWHSVTRMIRVHPWMGFGLNTFNATFSHYKDPAIWGMPYAHNCFLQLTAELGLIGLSIFVWFLARVFKQGVRPAQRSSWERLVAISLLGGAAGYVIQSTTDNHWYSLPLAAMWWTMIGLMDGLQGLSEDRQRLFTETVRRIVAIRTDRLGDVLMNLPALQALKARFPKVTVTLVVTPPLDDLLRGQPGLDVVIAYDPRPTGKWRGAWRWAAALRRGRFDAAVILNPTQQAHVAAWLAGIPIRVGYARKWDFLLTDTLPDRKAAGDRHEVEYNLELVGLLGATSADRRPRLTVDPHDRQVVGELLDDAGLDPGKPLIALHPWTSDPVKQWPLASVAELIDILSAENTASLVLIGGPDEAEGARHFVAGLRTPVTSFVGQLSLRQLAALLAHCRLLVSNDSGPVHVAAAVGTPTVTLFSGRRPAATPQRWGPVGAGHTILVSRHPELPIPVDDVLAAIRRQLEQPKPTP